MALLNTAGRHQSVIDAARWLEPNPNLQPPQRDIVHKFAELAADLLGRVRTDNPQLTMALHRLTDAKDSAVRASLMAADAPTVSREAADNTGPTGWGALRT